MLRDPGPLRPHVCPLSMLLPTSVSAPVPTEVTSQLVSVVPEFERLLGVPSSSVLYVGDHIYGDMLRSKKESAWRTAMVIQELDAELEAPADLGDTPQGHRRIIPLTRGHAEGPYFDAELLPTGGADWQIVRASGSSVADIRPCRFMEYQRNAYTICEADPHRQIVRLYWKRADGTA